MPQVPERLAGYSVFRDGTERVGTADIELPSLESMSDTVSGAGIAGEVESPTIGFYSSLGVTLNFRTLDVPMIRLAAPKAHALDFRGSQQAYNSTTGEYESIPVRVSVRAVPKNTTLGNFEVNAGTGSSIEMECNYLLIFINNVKMLELDKFNNICWIDGVDYLAQYRQHLGL
ncbi:phage major tail tube protein [Paenibacillus sp. RS8]|jgi:P2 family phage contractile tail tube protein|uniref:phage major tail tube protein n=1 Tax=Paenibacillus sp. RS8 TaxID=3242681 RepID=UPI0035C03B3F